MTETNDLWGGVNGLPERTTGGYRSRPRNQQGLGLGGTQGIGGNPRTGIQGTPYRRKGDKYTYHGKWPLPQDTPDDGGLVGYDDTATYYVKGQMPKPEYLNQNPATGVNTYKVIEELKASGEKGVRKLQMDLLRGGWITKQSVTGTWTETTENAMKALMFAANSRGTSWGDLLTSSTTGEIDSPYGTDGTSGTDGSSAVMPQNYTERQFSIDRMPKKDAYTALKDAMKQDLGRAPTDDEMQGFIKELRQFEKANPDETVTKHSFSKGPNEDQFIDTPTTINKPGADPASLFDEYAEQERPKEVRKYKKANMLMSIISDLADGAL